MYSIKHSVGKFFLWNALTSYWICLGSINENVKNKCNLRFQTDAETIYNPVFTVRVLIQYIYKHIQRFWGCAMQ